MMENVRELIRLAHRQIDSGAPRLRTAAELIALVKSYRGEQHAGQRNEWLQASTEESEREATAHKRYYRTAYPGGRRAAECATATAKAGESD